MANAAAVRAVAEHGEPSYDDARAMITTTRLPAPRVAAIVLAVAAVGGAGVVAARRAAEVAPIAVGPSEVAFDPFATPAPPPPPARHDCTLKGMNEGLHVHAGVPAGQLRPGRWTFEVTAGAMTLTVALVYDHDRRGAPRWRCLGCDADIPFFVRVEPPWYGSTFAIYIAGRDRLPLAASTIDLTVRHDRRAARRSITPRYERVEVNGPGCGYHRVAREALQLDLVR
jgi:hypothetical protein